MLEELKRVLRGRRAGGYHAVPGAITVHNPHHVAEITADELERLLRARFAHVSILAQHSAVASVIDVGPRDGQVAVTSPPLGWTAGPVEPLYAVALAGDGDLPDLAPTGALAAGVDIGGLVSSSTPPPTSLRRRAGRACARERSGRARLRSPRGIGRRRGHGAADRLAGPTPAADPLGPTRTRPSPPLRSRATATTRGRAVARRGPE